MNPKKDKKHLSILVAGGAGFLGSNLVKDLLDQGHDVVVVDNLITGDKGNLEMFMQSPRFSFFEMGVETPGFAKKFVEGDIFSFDEVYDLACPTGVPNIQILGEEMLDTCSIGTKNVLRVALKHNAKFILTSSSEVYGDPEIFPQTESYTGNVDPQGIRASYEEGKRFSEALTSLFAKKYGLDAKTVRLFNVYGPNMNARDQRVIPRFVRQALADEPLTVHDTDSLRTMCYVTDIIRGLRLVIREGKKGGIYNLGSDSELAMSTLAAKVIEATGSKSRIEFIPNFIQDHKRRMPDLSKVKKLGWAPRISLEEGLELTIKDFKQNVEHNAALVCPSYSPLSS